MDKIKPLLRDIGKIVAKSHPDLADGTVVVVNDPVATLGLDYGSRLTMQRVRTQDHTVLVRVPKKDLAAVQAQFPDVRVVAPQPSSEKKNVVVISTKGVPRGGAPRAKPRPPAKSPDDGWEPVMTEISDPLQMLVVGPLKLK